MYHPLAGLDQYIRLTLNAVSWVKKAKWPWRSRSMTPIFNTSWKNAKMHIWCKFVNLAQIHYKSSHRQVKFPRILSQNDLEGQSQWPSFSISVESISWCMFGANLVIQTQICDESSCGQSKVYGQRQTDGQTQTTTIPSAWKAKG